MSINAARFAKKTGEVPVIDQAASGRLSLGAGVTGAAAGLGALPITVVPLLVGGTLSGRANRFSEAKGYERLARPRPELPLSR